MKARFAMAAGLVAVLLAACSASGPTESTEPEPTSPPPTSRPDDPAPPSTGEQPLAEGEPQAIDWTDPSVAATFDGGWTIRACEGDAPLLCVDRDGVPVGVVEAMAYRVDSIDALDPAGDAAQNLRLLADDFLESLAADRAAGCGPDYQLTPLAPESFPIGGRGLAYGFEGTLPNGEPSELNLQYATIVNNTVIAIVAAAYDEGGCPGRDDLSGFDSATLREFQDYLEIVLVDSPLPDLVGG